MTPTNSSKNKSYSFLIRNLRLDKGDSHENKVAEIKLLVPGNDLFAKRQCKTFEEATDLAVEALRRQLKKQKGAYMYPTSTK